MTNINIEIHGAHAKKASQDGILTTGMVGATVTFTFDSEWDGLHKTAVFRGGGLTKDALNIGSVVKIPSEVLQQGSLYVGVEGYNADGTVVIPTVWVTAGIVCSGANASGDPSTDPTLPVWAQIQAMIGDLDKLNTRAKNDLVAAVNEALTKGGGTVDPVEIAKLVDEYLTENPPAAGKPGKDGASAYEIAVADGFKGTETEWLASLKGADGKDGTDGRNGVDGKSAYQYAQDGGYTGTEEEFAEKLAEEMPNIAPVEATADMTQSVGIDGDGKLWTAPGNSGTFRLLDVYDFSSGALSYATTGVNCHEIIVVVTAALETTGAKFLINGLHIGDTPKLVGGCSRFTALGDGTIIYLEPRITDYLANTKSAVGSGAIINSIGVDCSSASSGIIRIYGR